METNTKVYVVEHSVKYEGSRIQSIHKTMEGATKWIEDAIKTEYQVFKKTFYKVNDKTWEYHDQTYEILPIQVKE